MKSRGLRYDFCKSGSLSAEISVTTNEGKTQRYGVDLTKRTCDCGQWEVSGKPFTHAIFLFGKVRQLKVEDYVDNYYSVERFKIAYQFEITPMGDHLNGQKMTLVLKWFLHHQKGLLVDQGSKESRLVESQDIQRRAVMQLKLNQNKNFHPLVQKNRKSNLPCLYLIC